MQGVHTSHIDPANVIPSIARRDHGPLVPVEHVIEGDPLVGAGEVPRGAGVVCVGLGKH